MKVVQVAVRVALQSSGQNCAGSERFYVHNDVYSAFVSQVVKIVKSMCCKYTKLYFAANSHVTTFIALSSESCSASQDYNLVLSFQYYYLLLMSFEQIKICAFKREIMNILLACLTFYSISSCFKVLRYQMF